MMWVGDASEIKSYEGHSEWDFTLRRRLAAEAPLCLLQLTFLLPSLNIYFILFYSRETPCIPKGYVA
jgi:hypothetical protein